MENEIDAWIREHEDSGDPDLREAARLLKALRGTSEGWQKQAGFNLCVHQEDVCQLIRLGLNGDARSVELYARRMRRRFPALADAITPLLPPVNPLRAERADTPTSRLMEQPTMDFEHAPSRRVAGKCQCGETWPCPERTEEETNG